jgi:hypothetical protein
VTERPSLTIHNEPPSSWQPKETLASETTVKRNKWLMFNVLCYYAEKYTKSRSLI